MTREIKYKVWDIHGKNMSKPLNKNQEFKFSDKTQITIAQAFRYPQDYLLLQFTGLKDKNGKEIYEGDILKLCNCCGLVGEVVFENAEFHSMNKAKSYIKHKECPNWEIIEMWKTQSGIIGNKFKNPELLK